MISPVFQPFRIRPPRPIVAALGLLVVAGLPAACGDGLGPESDRAPQAVGDIPDLLLQEGRSAEVDVAAYFTDPEGGALSFSAASSNRAVATVSVSGTVVTVSSVSRGAVRVAVTATDPGGQAAQQVFGVAVPASPVVELTAPGISAAESDKAVLPLFLSVPPATPITVTYSLGMDSDAGTADADPDDFAGGATGSVEIEAGATEAAIEILFNDDDDIEPTRELFTLTLDEPGRGAGYTVGPRRRAAGTIEEGICDRTREVQAAILSQVELAQCAHVTTEHLARVLVVSIPSFQSTEFGFPDPHLSPAELCDADSWNSPDVAASWPWLESTECGSDPTAAPRVPEPASHAAGSGALTALKSGDFAGLDNVTVVVVRGTQLETLPADVFAGLRGLRQLALIQNRIGELPDGVFSDLGDLEVLALSSNRLAELPDGVFSGLGGLSSLLLDDNLLADIPATISRLENLQVVWLNNNRLTDLPAEGPPGLVWLQAGYNELAELPSGWLSASPELSRLHLQENRIPNLPAGAFSALPNLEELFLFSNRIEVLPPGVFSGLKSLRRLMLASNQIGAVPPGIFSELESLEWLALDRNRIGELPADAFAGLPLLKRLWLADNQLTELPPGVFSNLPELGLLSVAINELSEVPAGAFANLALLQALFLLQNQLAELPDDLLAGLDSLEVLNVADNLIEELPEGVFLGLSRLRRLNLEDNPGSPFPLNPVVARTDSRDALAPGPARVAGRLALGAPFDLRLPLSVHYGELSGDVLLFRAGEDVTAGVTVTRAAGRSGTQVSAGPLPRLPNGFTGITLELDDPLVLFGELDNHAPVAVSEIAGYRLRVGGQPQALSVSSHFRDLDADELTYSLDLSNPGVVSLTNAGDQITLVPETVGSTLVTVTATDPGGLSASTSFSVTVRGFIPGSFDIDVVVTDSVSAELRAAFEQAAGWWMTILAATELPDIPGNVISAVGCDDIVSDQSVASIDDLMVVMAVRTVDGPGGVLARARPCGVREGSMLPFMGTIQFDKDDLEGLLERGNTDDVEELILHEMGHVLGIGSIWSNFGLLREPSVGGPPGADTHFAGPLAIGAFDEAGGQDYDGAKVPVENQAGAGSGDSHWRESVLVTELMTPFASIGFVDPLSAITIQSLADLGYTVNVALADPFTLPRAAAADREDVPVIDLRNDVMTGPVIVVSPDGRVVRVIGN